MPSSQQLPDTKNNPNAYNSNPLNAELSARFQKYRSNPASVTALIQILQQKMRILAVNSNIPIPYCMQFQKSIIDKIRKIPQMNSNHVDYIQSLYDKQIHSLENQTSAGHKILHLMNERSKILKDVKIMLVKEKLANNGTDKKPSLNLTYLGQEISKLRDLALGIIEHLSLWKSSLNSTGEDEYSKLILQCISKDGQFLRSTPLRKFLQFSSSQDPLFLYSMKKFWKLELNTNYNSRAITKLFEVPKSYQKRLLNADKFTKCFDPNAVIYEYPFGDTEEENQSFHDHEVGSQLMDRQKSSVSNLPIINRKNSKLSHNIKHQSHSSELRSLESSPKKAFELLKPIIEQAKLQKYHRPVNMMGQDNNLMMPATFENDKLFQQNQTEAIANFGPNRKNRVMTQVEPYQGKDLKNSIRKYPATRNDHEHARKIQGKHRSFFQNDKRRKLKPILNHSLSHDHQNLGQAFEALNEMVEEDQGQRYALAKNEDGGSRKTIKMPSTITNKPSNIKSLKRHSLHLEQQGGKNQFIGKSPQQKIFNQVYMKNYQTEDELDKQNLSNGSDFKKQVELQAIKKKQLELQKALKRYEMEDMYNKKPKAIDRNHVRQNVNEEPTAYGAPSSISSKIRIKQSNPSHKGSHNRKDPMHKAKSFNSMDEDYEEENPNIIQVSQFEENPDNQIQKNYKNHPVESPGRQNALYPSPQRNQHQQTLGSLQKSLQKSPKSTNRQNGKIKIIPMVYKNGELSPATKKSYRKNESSEKQHLGDNFSSLKSQNPSKVLVEQSIQALEKLPAEHKVELQKGSNSIPPSNPSPYSQYLNEKIKDGEKKNDSPSINLVNTYRNDSNETAKYQSPNNYDPNIKLAQEKERPKESMQKTPSLQNAQIPRKLSIKNPADPKQYQNSQKNERLKQSESKINEQQQQNTFVSDDPIYDYEVPKQQQRDNQSKGFNGNAPQSNLQNLVHGKIEPKSQSYKNISPNQTHDHIKDQGKSLRNERQMQQNPVSSHKIYQVAVEDRGNDGQRSLDQNKEIPVRASSLLSNRSGSQTQRSSISKSSSMKLDPQTSKAMNAYTNSPNHKNQETPMKKVQTKERQKNETGQGNKKLATIQQNQAYPQVPQYSMSPQQKNMNSQKNTINKNMSNPSNNLSNIQPDSNSNRNRKIQDSPNGQTSERNLNKGGQQNTLTYNQPETQSNQKQQREQAYKKPANSINPSMTNQNGHQISANLRNDGKQLSQMSKKNQNGSPKLINQSSTHQNLTNPRQNNQIQSKPLSTLQNPTYQNSNNQVKNPNTQIVRQANNPAPRQRQNQAKNIPNETKNIPKDQVHEGRKVETKIEPESKSPSNKNLNEAKGIATQKKPVKQSLQGQGTGETKNVPQQNSPQAKNIPTHQAETIMYHRNISQLSATAEKGSEYKHKEKDKRLDLSISEYSDSDEGSDESESEDEEQVNINWKEQIVNKEKIGLVKEGNPASWENPQKPLHGAVQEKTSNTINRPDNALKHQQGNRVQNSNQEPYRVDSKGNQPTANSAQQKINQSQQPNNLKSLSGNNNQPSSVNQSPSGKGINQNINSGTHLNQPALALNQPQVLSQSKLPSSQLPGNSVPLSNQDQHAQQIQTSKGVIPEQQIKPLKEDKPLQESKSFQQMNPSKTSQNTRPSPQVNPSMQNNIKPTPNQKQKSSGSLQKNRPNQAQNQQIDNISLSPIRDEVSSAVKLNSISHDNDTTNEAIKLNTISPNNTIVHNQTIQTKKTMTQPNFINGASLSSIQSKGEQSSSGFVGNNSTLNFNIPNNQQTISSENSSRNNTIESNQVPTPKPLQNPTLNIDTSSSPTKTIPPKNLSPTNAQKTNQQTLNPDSKRNHLNLSNNTISENSSQQVSQAEKSQTQLKAIAEKASSLTKCVFQSKTLSKQQLPKFLAKYQFHPKVIEQIENGYFSHRQLHLNICMLNQEVISVILSHVAFVGADRVMYLVLFKVVSDKYLDLSPRLLSTAIKYIFYNDPCENVVCLRQKQQFLSENDKLLEKNFALEVKNIKGKTKNSCIGPLLTGEARPSVFESTNYLVNRKDMNCKNDQLYMNNIEFEVFIVGKQAIKVPQKPGKLILSNNYRTTIQTLFSTTQRNNMIKIFKSKAQLFEYTQEEEVGAFQSSKTLASIKDNQKANLFLYQRHMCKLDPKVKYTSYGGVYYFLLEEKRTWYWEKNNVGYFIVKCNLAERQSESGSDMVSEASSRSSVSDWGSFGKNEQKPKRSEFYYIYIDYVFESEDLVDGAAQIKQNIEGKPISEVLKTEKQHQHKIITIPCYEGSILVDRYNSEGYIFNFKMNLTWKNYLRGVRSMPEEDIVAQYIGPFYVGVLMKDESDTMRFVAGTFVSPEEQNTEE